MITVTDNSSLSPDFKTSNLELIPGRLYKAIRMFAGQKKENPEAHELPSHKKTVHFDMNDVHMLVSVTPRKFKITGDSIDCVFLVGLDLISVTFYNPDYYTNPVCWAETFIREYNE